MTLRHTAILLGCLLLVIHPLGAQQAAAGAPASERSAENNDQKFATIIAEAQKFQADNQLLDAKQKLDEADSLKPGTALVFNMRGSLYTAMRDFDKAQTAFEQARDINPAAFEPRFNLTELQFVRGHYKEAEKNFATLLQEYPKLRIEIRHITLFKILVCQIKQEKTSEAEATMKNFTFMDDTPAYYFAKACFAFQAGDKVEGQRWITKAGQIFKQGENIPYLDSLIESRWVDSLGIPNDFDQ